MEYRHIDDAGWRQGRAAVLQRFLGAERIYATSAMHERRSPRRGEPHRRTALTRAMSSAPWQPQPDPQPPVGMADEPPDADVDAEAAPVEANTDKSRMAPSWPSGQDGALASLIGRRTSNVDAQVRQRYS